MNENEILDDNFKSNDKTEKSEGLNYLKYTLTYIFLMLIVGSLLTKLMTSFHDSYWFLLKGAFVYIAIAFVLGLIQEGINYLYRTITNTALKNKHPIWFRFLETCFYIWCVIIIVTFVYNKLL